MNQLAYAWLATVAFAVSLGYFLYAYLFTFGVHTSAWPGAGRPTLVNVALFTAFCLHHSAFAHPPLKQFVTRIVSPALERATYSLVASILFLLVCALWQPVPGTLYAVPAPWNLAGYAVQAVGIGLTIAGSRALDVFDLSGLRQVRLAASGEAPRHHRLETRGVYGLVRHPLYLGWALFVFGAPSMTLTRFTFAVISTAYLALAIPLEERGLIQAFGAEYHAYRKRVRWRMLPGLY